MKLKQIRVDGYKNLIDCVLNLGDFNVLVGSNNSGKSNFLEAIQMLFFFCLGDEKIRDMAFKGFPTRGLGTSICQISDFADRPLSVGVTFETHFDGSLWIVDYDFTVQRQTRPSGGAGFVEETLSAKPVSRTGVPTAYITRDLTHLKVKGKSKQKIASDIPVFSAMKTIYPEFTGLPSELKQFVDSVTAIALADILLVSPEMLRKALATKTPPEGFRISSFDILSTIDEIHQEEGGFELFKETVCNVLDIEDLKFTAHNIPAPSAASDEKPTERVTYCYLKRQGHDYAHLAEYSDGTLAVVAIVSAIVSRQFTGPILLVEELENSLHPSALQRLLRFMQDHSQEWPILITTHSPYVLNCVNPENVNVAIVDERGATHFDKVENTKQLRDYLKSGFMSFGDMLASNFEDVLGK